VVTTFYLARIVAETGPLSDFQTVKQLFKYAGLDLQVRQSGKFKGKTKISKRGRTALRKVLTFAVLPLVKKNGLYGKMYHSIKDKREMPGAKAMIIIAKKFLKMIFGIYRSGTEYDASRVFECHSQHKKAA
jgi:transposase